MTLRRTSRRDDNEMPIIRALEAIGAQVKPLHRPCDLLVRWRGQIHLLEIDNPASKYRQRDAKQLEFLRLWEVAMVQTPAEAFHAIGASHHA
jgi:hypothetical protein